VKLRMEQLENIKRSILAYIQRRQRVKLSELRQWAIENNVGLLTLYVTLGSIIQEKQRDLVLGPPEPLVNSDVEVMGRLLDLKLPSEIAIQVKQRRGSVKPSQRRRIKGQRTLLDVLKGQETQPKEVKPTASEAAIRVEVKEETEETVGSTVVETTASSQEKVNPSEASTQEGEAVEVNENEPAPEAQGINLVNPTQLTLSQLAQLLSSELKINQEDAVKVLSSIGQYLNRYWSVGLIRLMEDAAKGLNPDLVQRVLKVLERLGFIEIVNPGIINRRRDVKFPVSETKISDLA